MEMRARADLKRIEAETVAKAKIERENQDLYLEQIRLKAKESRNTIMEGISTAGSVLGAGAEAFLRDWDKVKSYFNTSNKESMFCFPIQRKGFKWCQLGCEVSTCRIQNQLICILIEHVFRIEVMASP